jgi:Tfp pilus assembly protein PilV
MRRLRRQQEAGFTFNEILVAMGLIVLVVMGLSLSSIGVTQWQTVSDSSTVAIHLAQDKLEELQSQTTLVDTDLCPSGGDHGISPKTGVGGIFDRCWRIAPSSLAGRLKQIDVTVSWQNDEPRKVTLSTLSFNGD